MPEVISTALLAASFVSKVKMGIEIGSAIASYWPVEAGTIACSTILNNQICSWVGYETPETKLEPVGITEPLPTPKKPPLAGPAPIELPKDAGGESWFVGAGWVTDTQLEWASICGAETATLVINPAKINDGRYERKAYLVNYVTGASTEFKPGSSYHKHGVESLPASEYPQGVYRVYIVYNTSNGQFYDNWGPELTIGKESASIEIKDPYVSSPRPLEVGIQTQNIKAGEEITANWILASKKPVSQPAKVDARGRVDLKIDVNETFAEDQLEIVVKYKDAVLVRGEAKINLQWGYLEVADFAVKTVIAGGVIYLGIFSISIVYAVISGKAAARLHKSLKKTNYLGLVW